MVRRWSLPKVGGFAISKSESVLRRNRLGSAPSTPALKCPLLHAPGHQGQIGRAILDRHVEDFLVIGFPAMPQWPALIRHSVADIAAFGNPAAKSRVA
jgi:hypothetical protein